MRSALPAAITALLALLPAWPDLAGVDIRDAGQAPDESGPKAIFVGDTQALDANNQPVDTAADYSADLAGLGGREQETFMIHCAAAFLDTNSSYANARAQVTALRDAVGSCLAAHMDLGGAIQGKARLGGGSLRYVRLDVGIKAVLLFDVDVESFTT